jgi:hypothetical protein
MSVIVVPSFHDQKKKSSGGGGFSDGGVHCERLSLGAQSVEVGPPPGVAWGGFNAAAIDLEPASVQAVNFDPAISCGVEEYFVFEDGTEQLTGPATPVTANVSTTNPSLNAGAVASCSPYLKNGGVLAYPNKLRYKLILGYQQVALPTGRVLLHFDVAEFDLPKDQG